MGIPATQQLAFTVWSILNQGQANDRPVEQAIVETVRTHDFDYERLWSTMNNTDKKTLTKLSRPMDIYPAGALSKAANLGLTSTIFSSLKRLMQSGNLIKTAKGYEIDDPFFKQWIIEHRNL